jgi:hypothetical protein
MPSGPRPASRREVAVGPDRVGAARIFGRLLDDAHVTSYDDLALEVAPTALGTLALVASAPATELVSGLPGPVAATLPERLLLGTGEDLAERTELLRALEANPALRPRTLTLADGAVVVALAPAADVDDDTAARVLADLRALEPVGPPAAPVTEPDLRPRGLLRRVAARLNRG